MRTRTIILFIPLLFALWALSPVASAQAQTGAIAGTVVDSTSGETIPGASVAIQGTNRGAITDIDGNYTIANVEPGTYEVRATYIGYQTQAVTDVVVEAGQTTELNFSLSSTTIGLEEIVVVGYGEQRRRDLTGSVASVEGEDIAEVPTPSVAQALQGRAAGVQVVPSSGEPGAAATIRIRGIGTLNNASPLFVVDGMLMDDISFLNPNDVASLEVLKDASATAIYGSRGANGVIIITTRSGGFAAAPTFTFNSYYGWENVMNEIDLVGPQEYAMLANELAANQGLDPVFEDPSAVGEGTDWQDELYRTAPIQNYQVAAAGGTEQTSYRLSANYIRQNGILPNSTFQRASLRLNNDYRLSDFIQLGHNIAFAHTRGREAAGGLVRAAYFADPTATPRTEEGEFSNDFRSDVGNPAATVFYSRNQESGNRLVGNLFLDASFLRDFTFRSNFGIDYGRSEIRQFTPQYFVGPKQQSERSQVTVRTEQNSSWLWENTVTYDRDFGDHRLNVLTGITAQAFNFEDLGGSRVRIIGEDESLWYLNAGDAEGQSNFNSAFDWRMFSYLFRTNYSLMNRYLLTATLRADGSSRFGERNRFGYFPSIALGWNVSEEPFMRSLGLFDYLKIRGSWGQVGNDKIGAYPSIPTVSGNLNAVFGSGSAAALNFGASLVALANPDIRWERTTQTDLGLEMGFLDGRLFATVDFYNRETDGVLINVPIPAYVGVNTEPTVNAATVLNRGFDFDVNWDGTAGPFDYGIDLVASTIHNEVTELGGGREAIFGGGLGNEVTVTTRTMPGLPIGAFYGYEVEGVFQNEQEIEQFPTRGGEEPGDLRYRDLDGDGVITGEDRVYLGSPIPDFIYGINLDFAYRNVDLSLGFNGQTGNVIYNGKKATRFGVENFESSYLDRWHGEGTSNTEPRVTNAGHNYLASERFLEDGSFFKLRNVQLGYTLPERLLNQLNVNRARLYVAGSNLFTITDYSGYSPEITGGTVISNAIDLGVYPISRTITVGVDLSF